MSDEHRNDPQTEFDSEAYIRRKMTKQMVDKASQSSEKNPFVCMFLTLFHLHYFYVGRVGRGVLCLLTLNFLFIGTLIDLILIVCGKFKDADGRYVTVHRMAAAWTLKNDRK